MPPPKLVSRDPSELDLPDGVPEVHLSDGGDLAVLLDGEIIDLTARTPDAAANRGFLRSVTYFAKAGVQSPVLGVAGERP